MTAEFARAERGMPGRARRLVVAALEQCGHDEILVADAALVLSELASNAVLHAGSPFSVSVRATGSTLRIAVSDSAPLRASSHDGGLIPRPAHGLSLVQALCCCWGVEGTAGGKVVWAELSVAGRRLARLRGELAGAPGAVEQVEAFAPGGPRSAPGGERDLWADPRRGLRGGVAAEVGVSAAQQQEARLPGCDEPREARTVERRVDAPVAAERGRAQPEQDRAVGRQRRLR